MNIPTKKFDVGDVKRASIELSLEAQQATMQASREGVLFPQALAEAFGETDLPVSISIDIVPKHLHHIAENEDEKLCQVTIKSENDSEDGFKTFLNMSALYEERMGRQPGFQALQTARDIVKMYRHHIR